MIKRLRILTLLQLGNKIKVTKLTDKKKFALSILLMSLLTIGITAVLTFVLNFTKNVLFLPVNKGMLTFILLISQGIGIIASTNTLMHSLYESRDNAILLSFPARPNEVFISKLLVSYLHQLRNNIYFLLPLLIGYGIVTGGGAIFYIFSILFFFLLPLFTVFIGAIISIPLKMVKKLIDRVPIIYLVLIVGIVVLVFLGLNAFVATIPKPLRIVAVYTKFVNGITSFIVSANAYALFYVFVGNVLYSVNLWLNLLYLVAIAIGLVVLVYFISMPLYFRLASSANEHTTKKQRASSPNRKTTFFAFLKKEMLLTVRSVNQVINNYFLIILMPIILFVMNVILSSIITSVFGDSLIIASNIMVSGILILSSNTQSASAITVEGDDIILLKTAPSNTANMVWAKMFMNVIISSTLILISSVILNVSGLLETSYVWYMFFMLIFINFGHILWSFQLDVVSPNLREYAENGRLDNCPNINMSMTLGLIISLVFGFFCAFLLTDNWNSAWIKLLVIAIAFFALRLYIFIRNLNVYFKRIEY